MLFLKHLPFLVTCGQRKENILFLRMFIKSLPKWKGLEDERERISFFPFFELLCLNFLDSGLGTLPGDKQGSLSLASWQARLGRTRLSWGLSVSVLWALPSESRSWGPFLLFFISHLCLFFFFFAIAYRILEGPWLWQLVFLLVPIKSQENSVKYFMWPPNWSALECSWAFSRITSSWSWM